MLSYLIDKCKEIAQAAGAEIMEVYQGDMDPGIETKSDNSPLTIADKRANDLIVSRLKELKYNFPIISEESKEIPFEERKNYSYLWMVDPLDGTKEFIKRNGEFTVNIALIHENRPVLGIVYAPAQKALFWAAKGEGAFYQIGDDPVKRAVSTPFSLQHSGIRVVCSRSHLNQSTLDLLDKLDEPQLVRTGSSLKFMLIAQGEADFYPRLGPTMEWDTAAADIIVEESGGKITQMHDESPLLYNKPSLLNPNFLTLGKTI
jgi:3'(2'), 5'-bisphosphate nucleotidase